MPLYFLPGLPRPTRSQGLTGRGEESIGVGVEREEKGIRVLEEKERERGQFGKRRAAIEEDKEPKLTPQHPTFISVEYGFDLE